MRKPVLFVGASQILKSCGVRKRHLKIADCGLRLADLLGDWSIRGRCDDWTPLIAVPTMKTAAKHQSFIKQIMQRLSGSSQQKLQHLRRSRRGIRGISLSGRPAEPVQICVHDSKSIETANTGLRRRHYPIRQVLADRSRDRDDYAAAGEERMTSHTSQRATASRSDVNGSRVGTNSCAT